MPEFLFVPKFPESPGIGKVDQINFVEVADVLIGEVIVAMQPDAADVEMAAVVTNQFLRIEVKQHEQGALVSGTGLDAAGQVVRIGGDVKEFKVEPALG